MDNVESGISPGDSSIEADTIPLRIGILTVSDRASRGEMEDMSGPAIRKAFAKAAFGVSVYACIADDRKQISRTLRRWADEDLCDCIVTTGGTGLAKRDVTPEATTRILDRALPHLASHLALAGIKTAPTAVLSRGVAGARGRTLIVNLPGSPSGAASGAKLLSAIAAHAVAVLRGEASHPDLNRADAASGDGADADV